MNLSQLPELREYRDDLAGKMERKRGLNPAAALEAANLTAVRIYRASITGTGKPRGKLTDGAVCEAVAGTVAGVRRIAGVAEMAAPKAKPKKRKDDAIVREAVQAAVARALAETVPAAAAAPAGTPPAARPLTEVSSSDLDDLVGEALLSGAREQPEAAGDASGAMHGLDLTGDPKELQGLRDDDFLDFLGAAFITDGAERLGSPAFQGARAVSPFMQGL